MKNFLIALSPVLFLLLFTSCSHSQQIPKGMYRFVGLWEAKTDEGTRYELWEVNPDSTLHGKDFIIDSNGVTTILEEFEVIPQDSSIYYVAKVKNQNDGKPVYFKMIVWTNTVFIFENKEHDFPQMITYSVKTLDLFNVILEGPEKDNTIKSIEYRFNKIK